MVYDPNGSDNKSLLSLVQGTISFVAGATAKHGDMKVDTPVATMGIRGTAVLVEIDFEVPGQGGAPSVEIPGAGRAGRHHRLLHPVRQDHADADRDRQPGRHADDHQRPGHGQLPVVGATVGRCAEDHHRRVLAEVHRPQQSEYQADEPSSPIPIVPENQFVKLARRSTSAPVKLQFISVPDKPAAATDTGPGNKHRSHSRAAGSLSPSAAALTERVDITASSDDRQRVRHRQLCRHQRRRCSERHGAVRLPSPTRTRSRHDVTATLTAEQLAAIQRCEVPLVVVQDPDRQQQHGIGDLDLQHRRQRLRLPRRRRDADADLYGAGRQQFRAEQRDDVQVRSRSRSPAPTTSRPLPRAAARSPSGSAPAIRRSTPSPAPSPSPTSI